MVPNLTLIEVRPTSVACARQQSSLSCLGEEVRRVVTKGSQGELTKGGRREAQEGL